MAASANVMLPDNVKIKSQRKTNNQNIRDSEKRGDKSMNNNVDTNCENRLAPNKLNIKLYKLSSK